MAIPLFETIQAFDESVLRTARGAPEWAVPVFFVFTIIGAGWGFFAVLPFLVWRLTRVTTLWLLLAAGATSALVSMIKFAVGRVRPCDALGWCSPLWVTSPGGGSFPSGHAAGSFAVAAFVAVRTTKLGAALLVYAAMVAWSRCALGVHYPSDVFAGSMLGAIVGATFAWATRAAPGITTTPRSGSQSPESSPSQADGNEMPG